MSKFWSVAAAICTLAACAGVTGAQPLRCGAKVCEYDWTGIGGTKVTDLTGNRRFPNNPNYIRKITNGRFQMRQRGNNLGAMLEGYVKAPTSGRYTFSTQSDDASEVWVATRPNTRTTSLVKVVELTGCCRKINGRRQVQFNKGQAYYIRALVKEGGGGEYLNVGMKVGNKEYFPIPISMFKQVSFKSALRCGAKACEYDWTGIGGTKVSDLTRNKRFPNSPNSVKKLTNGRFEMRQKGNNLGAVLEGFVNAPTSGRYTFSTHSDDASEVWAARNAYTQEGLVKVVELTGCCRKINGRTQLSWTKGQAYYIRALVKEGSGGEYLKVGIVVGRKEYFPIPISMFTTIPPFCIGKATVGNTCSGTKASGTKQGHWLFSLTARAKYPATGNSKGWHVDCGKYVHYYDKIRAWDNSVRLNFDCQDASSHYKTAPRCHQFVGCNSGQQYPACPITELELWWR
jgi:hypothetical protein